MPYLIGFILMVLLGLWFIRFHPQKWWMHPHAAYSEAFTQKDYPYHDASIDSEHPYHLLSDRLPAKHALSQTGSQACYQMDAEQALSKTGSFRQLTNNYKRTYPDNCSMGHQDLLLNFYEPTA